MITKSFTDSDGTYGYRRVHADLLDWGHPCSPELVRDLMRQLELVPCQPRPKRRNLTEQAAQTAPIPDLVQRDFTATEPGAKLVGDITYIRTGEGWLYLALVIDCYSRKIVGWAMADHYRTPLITKAIQMAAANLQLRPSSSAVFHSDRGSNYTSEEYGQVLGELGIQQSVGRTGICYDNALSESTNGAVKVELVNRQEWPTMEMARTAIARYIELFYNTRRRHSYLNYQTPQEVLDEYYQNQATA